MTENEILTEKSTQSTWITDLSNNRDKKLVTMTLNNGTRYMIYDVTRHKFDQWHKAPSKGKFWHTHIKDNHTIKKVI